MPITREWVSRPQISLPSLDATPLATRKTKIEFVETFDNGISRTFALEQLEDGANRALHFLIGIEHDLVAIIHITNRQLDIADSKIPRCL